VKSTTAGVYGVTATVGSALVENGSPANVTFVNGGVDHAVSTFAVTPAGPVAAGGQYAGTVTIIGESGNPLPGVAVTFALDPSVTIVEAGPYTTGADGKVTVHFTSLIAGTTNVSAFTSAAQIGTAKPLTFTAAGPDVGAAGLSVISATTGDRLANGSATHRVTVLLKDQYGNVISGTPVAFQLPAGVSPVGATTVSTALDGTAYLDVKSTTAGVYGVTATVGSALVENGSPANVTFVAGLVSLTSSTIEATPATIDAVTGTSTVVVTLRDANGNLVSAPHAVVISTNLGVVSATSAGTPGKYSATLMAPSTGGTATLSFTVNALPATPVATVKVLAPALLPCRLDLKLNVTEVRAGETVMATVTGARPGENVVAVLNPSGLALGTIVAGPTGTAVFELKLPASLALGSHSVVVTSGEGCMPVFATMTLLGDEEVESDDTQETPPTANPSLPATGLQLGIEVPIGALMLLVAGGFMLARNRREGETD
jgi:adhesin/invasin